MEQVMAHPRLGFSWEGFALEEVLLRLRAERDAYFFKTHGGTELDLLLMWQGKRLGFEFKFQDAPRVTKAMRLAMQDLRLDHLYIVSPGRHRYPLDERIEVMPLSAIEL